MLFPLGVPGELKNTTFVYTFLLTKIFITNDSLIAEELKTENRLQKAYMQSE